MKLASAKRARPCVLSPESGECEVCGREIAIGYSRCSIHAQEPPREPPTPRGMMDMERLADEQIWRRW